MSRGVLTLLDPKGNAFLVAREGLDRGYELALVTAAPETLKGVPEQFQDVIDRLKMVVRVHSWQDLKSVFRATRRIESELGPIRGTYGNRDLVLDANARLRLAMGLPTTAPERLALVQHKLRLRQALYEARLSRLRPVTGAEADGWSQWPPGAVYYLKYAHSGGKTGTKRCAGLGDLAQGKADYARSAALFNVLDNSYLQSTPDYHLEPEVVGELLSVECFVLNGQFVYLGMLSRILCSFDPVVEMGGVLPYPHPLEAEIVAHVERVLRFVGYEGPAHVECIVTPEGEVEVIDLNARVVGGEGMRLLDLAYGDPWSARVLLDWAVGETPALPDLARPYQFACKQFVLPPQGEERLDTVELPSGPWVPYAAPLLRSGSPIRGWNRQVDWVAVYVTTGATYREALQRSLACREAVRINGRPGVF